MQFEQLNLDCMKMELCAQVGLWIQVSNVRFRMWWLKANLGKGHWWEVEILLCPLLSEISSSQSFLGLAQLAFTGSQNSAPYPPCKRPVSFLRHWLFVSSWREGCGVDYFFNAIGLSTPLLFYSCSYIFYGIPPTPTCFCGIFTYKVFQEWDHVFVLPG